MEQNFQIETFRNKRLNVTLSDVAPSDATRSNTNSKIQTITSKVPIKLKKILLSSFKMKNLRQEFTVGSFQIKTFKQERSVVTLSDATRLDVARSDANR